MRILYQVLLACALPLALFGQQQARVTGAKVTEAGIYKAQVVAANTNAAGVKLQGLNEFTLLKSTTNVPARIGIRFGFRYEILGTPTNAPIMLTIVAKHPPLKNPATGKTGTQDADQLHSSIGKTYTSNSLDEESDLVPGQWTFEVWCEGEKLCEQSFLVVRDENKEGSKTSGERGEVIR
ncbi:MAG TPA: DUF3859 domain-containing protein [Candidatus Binatia bacterium]|jgi:hypothetical protein|nr:DUF3859 domain-containing protein [Candidatus Binatia bacterium]